MTELPTRLPKEIRVGGIITNVNQRFDKKNRPWAIISIEGMQGRAEIFIFNEVYEKHRSLLTVDSKVFFKGSPSNRNEENSELKFIGEHVYNLDEARVKLSKIINVQFTTHHSDEKYVTKLQNLVAEHKGQCSLVMHLVSSRGTVQRIRARKIKVSPSIDLLEKLRSMFSDSNVWIS